MEASQILQGIVWGVVLASTFGVGIAYSLHLWEERQMRLSAQREADQRGMVSKNWLVKK